MMVPPLILGAAEIGEPMRLSGGVPPANSFERIAELILLTSIDIGIIAIFIGILLCLWRLVRGPSLIDRGVAADTVALQVVGLVILLTVRLSSTIAFDAVLIVAILGFVTTVAFAQFIGRRGSAA